VCVLGMLIIGTKICSDKGLERLKCWEKGLSKRCQFVHYWLPIFCFFFAQEESCMDEIFETLRQCRRRNRCMSISKNHRKSFGSLFEIHQNEEWPKITNELELFLKQFVKKANLRSNVTALYVRMYFLLLFCHFSLQK